MGLLSWFLSRKRSASPSPRPTRRIKAPTTRLCLEPLEDRTLLSTGWAVSYGAPGSTMNQEAISPVDANGDFYVTGYFNGSATFGSTTLNASTQSSYVAKVDSATGNFLWATEIGGGAFGSFDIPAITIDSSGHVYAAGNFSGTASFGSTTLTSAGEEDIYICQLDSTHGNVLWASQAGGIAQEDVRSMTVDSSGDVFVTGMFDAGSLLSGMVQPGTVASATFGSQILTTTCSNGLSYAPVYLTELDSSGHFLHSEQLLGGTDGQPFGVATDSSGNAYVVGSASGFQGSNNAGFIEQVLPDGTLGWAQGMSGHAGDGAAIFEQDPTNNGLPSLYVSMNSGIEKLDAATGSVLWSNSFGGSSVAQARGAIAVDASGNVYVTGEYSGTVDFDPGSGTAVLTSAAGSEDAFLYKFDPSGKFLSAQSMGGPGYDMGCGLALDSSGDIYTVGNYQNTATFDTGSQLVSLTSPLSASSFLVKTTQDNGMIFGQVFNDLNQDGVFNPSSTNPESGIPNVTLYLDLNNSGSYVAGDPTTTTDAQGYFHFSDVAPGSYTVGQIYPSGYTASKLTPSSFPVSVSAGQASETTSFADYTPNKTRTYSNTSSVKTSAGKPNAISGLTVPDSYTDLGMTLNLNVNNSNHKGLTIYLTGPNGQKYSLGSTTQTGSLSFQVPYFDYTAVKGAWTLEVDGLAGGTLTNWSLNIDGTLS